MEIYVKCQVSCLFCHNVWKIYTELVPLSNIILMDLLLVLRFFSCYYSSRRTYWWHLAVCCNSNHQYAAFKQIDRKFHIRTVIAKKRRKLQSQKSAYKQMKVIKNTCHFALGSVYAFGIENGSIFTCSNSNLHLEWPLMVTLITNELS